MRLSRYPRMLWSRLKPRRADLVGREQGQAIVRVAVTGVVLGWLVFHHYPIDLDNGLPTWFIFLVGFLAFSAGIFVASMRDTRSPVYRRVVANAADITAVSYLMVSTGEAGIPLFVIYLWVTLGNGFRFGLAALATSTVLSLVGFGVVVAASRLWQQHVNLAAGITVALLVLPGYAAHLIRQLHRARERAEEASVAKSQFLARMSHELRTPLNGILGTTELLRNSRRLTNDERDLLGVIQDSVSVSLRQIDSVLDFARIEAGKLILEVADFDLHQVIHASMRMVNLAASDKKLRMLVRIAPETPYRLVGDANHLRDVLLNLLSNAVKFTDTGYVALQVEPVSTTPDSVRLRFEVRDTGIGIAPEALERIWESFAQEDSGTNRRFGGTGLGTTIAKQLVELMGGKIAVSSIKGRGTIFWCELPIRRQPDDLGERGDILPDTRVLLLSADEAVIEPLRAQAQLIHSTLAVVTSLPEAVSTLARGIRLGNPWHVVFVDDRQVVLYGDQHVGKELVDKALAARTPLYLLADRPREVEQLCEWGYAGSLNREPGLAALAAALRASPHFVEKADASVGVVRVEPWAWGKRSKVPRRVLIADDNRTNLLILRQMLEAAGYHVDSAEDGEAALERLATGGYKAAVIDLHMPGFDGVGLLRRYRLLQPWARVPIVMLTADATFDAQSSSAEAGADAFLTKPVTAEKMLSTIDRLIQEREVHNLPVAIRNNLEQGAVEDTPVLDVTVLAELDRVCREPERLAAVVSTFSAEGESLLARIGEAVDSRNHSAFVEWVHAMKGNAANIGATQIVSLCRQLEIIDVLEFRREGARKLSALRELFGATGQALREFLPQAESHVRTTPDSSPTH